MISRWRARRCARSTRRRGGTGYIDSHQQTYAPLWDIALAEIPAAHVHPDVAVRLAAVAAVAVIAGQPPPVCAGQLAVDHAVAGAAADEVVALVEGRIIGAPVVLAASLLRADAAANDAVDAVDIVLAEAAAALTAAGYFTDSDEEAVLAAMVQMAGNNGEPPRRYRKLVHTTLAQRGDARPARTPGDPDVEESLMPIYVLNAGNQRAHIPAGPLSVSITGAVHDAALDLHAGPAQPVMRSSARHAVLPELVGPVTIAVRPASSTRFAAGTVVHLAIAHDIPAEVDPVQVHFDPIDVSGDSAVVFAELRPQGQHIEIAVSAVADTALSPLAAAARTSARRIIGRGTGSCRRTRCRTECLGVDAALVRRRQRRGRHRCGGRGGRCARNPERGRGSGGFRYTGIRLDGPGGARGGAVGFSANGLADAVRKAQPRWSAGARLVAAAAGRGHGGVF